MDGKRLIVVGLDAFDSAVADELIEAGGLPNLTRLRSRSVSWRLDHGLPERDTGLAWEQFATGLHPRQSKRWSAIRFDPHTYRVDQPHTTDPPFTAGRGIKTLILDIPRFSLLHDPLARGLSDWMCHDPGVPRISRPDAVFDEVIKRFGPSPALEVTYGVTWPDPVETIRMGRALVKSIERRGEIFRWLATERLPDFDLAILATGETHSAIETMWHGWDRNHPLHGAPSAGPARQALSDIYEAADRVLGDILEAFPNDRIMAFSHHGMAANTADLPAMLLLGELMNRYSLGTVAFSAERKPHQAGRREGGSSGATGWTQWVNERLDLDMETTGARNLLGRLFAHPGSASELAWMPTARYRSRWPRMKAFALPSYTVGAIRINVAGRESRGIVSVADYKSTVEEIALLLRDCRSIPDNKPLDIAIDATNPNDPHVLGPFEADLVVRWRAPVQGLAHPRYGGIGPAPWRRTGGHTGGLGFVHIYGTSAEPGDRGIRSTLDVPGLICELLGQSPSFAMPDPA